MSAHILLLKLLWSLEKFVLFVDTSRINSFTWAMYTTSFCNLLQFELLRYGVWTWRHTEDARRNRKLWHLFSLSLSLSLILEMRCAAFNCYCGSMPSRFFSFNFCDVAIPNITRGKIQIWLQVRERSQDSRHFLKSCYVLATSKNPMSKYGDFHVFLFRMWRTKRHLKEILQQ